ncbi:MAG: hypothetical protein AB7S26_25375 [Sandaracinaceae bacterium]
MSYQAAANVAFAEGPEVGLYRFHNWRPGTLTVDDAGISFHERGEDEPTTRGFSDIERVLIATHALVPDEVVLVMHDGARWGVSIGDGTPLVDALRAGGVTVGASS